MTIAERFAKYTNEQLIAGIASLKAKISSDEECMNKFKAKNDVEFFNVAKNLYEEDFRMLLDAECALSARV